MTNEELAEEIANEYVGSKYAPDSIDNKLHRLVIKQACMKMAKNVIQKSFSWIHENYHKYYDTFNFLEDYKDAMYDNQ